jgi:hypothetical protein
MQMAPYVEDTVHLAIECGSVRLQPDCHGIAGPVMSVFSRT